MKMGTAKQQGGRQEYHVPALEKGFAILEYLSRNSAGRTHADISNELGQSRTTVYSILCNLESMGYIRKGDDGNYYLGLGLYSLGMSAAYQVRKSAMLNPDITSLRNDLGLTVHVCGYSNGETICLEKLDGIGGIVFKSYIGERKPLHLSASGKAILAYLPQSEFDQYISGPLSVRTRNSLSTLKQLIDCRSQILTDGFSVDDEEGEAGVFCFGVPIFSMGGALFGAISISAIKSSIDVVTYGRYTRRIIQTGEAISRRLGYTGEYPLIC